MRSVIFKEKYFLLLVFAIAFSVRIGYSFFEKIDLFSDARYYDKIGRNISIGRGYTELEEGSVSDDRNVVAWAPGYPFFLALIYKVAGHSYPIVWVFQAIIGAWSCILVYFLAKKAFNQRVAFFSTIISAFCFDLVIYTGMLLTETLYIFLVLACFFYIFKAFDRSINIRYLIAGIFAGLSVLTRPIIMIFFIFLLLWGMKDKKIAKGILFFVFCLLLVISPWIIRNYRVYGQFIPISAAGGESFWVGNNPQADGECILTEEMYNPNLTSLELNYEGYKKGLSFIIRHPIGTLVLATKKMSLFWSLLRLDAHWPHMQGLDKMLSMALSFLSAAFIFCFGILGIIFSFKSNNTYRSWLRLFIIICPLSLLPFFVETRYRLPIYPFMIIFAGYTLDLLPEIKFAIKNKKIDTLKYLKVSAFLIAILFINSIYDLVINFGEVANRIRLLF